jgi:hypothetical protein
MRKLVPDMSGIEIVQYMAEHHTHIPLQLPIEFGRNGNKLNHTSAGKVLDKYYQQKIHEITDQTQSQPGEFVGNNSNAGSLPPAPRRKDSRDGRVKEFEKKRGKMNRNFEEAKKTPMQRKDSRDERVKELEKKHGKMNRNFEEAKKTPIGQQTSNLLRTNTFKGTLPWRRRRGHRLSSETGRRSDEITEMPHLDESFRASTTEHALINPPGGNDEYIL